MAHPKPRIKKEIGGWVSKEPQKTFHPSPSMSAEREPVWLDSEFSVLQNPNIVWAAVYPVKIVDFPVFLATGSE